MKKSLLFLGAAAALAACTPKEPVDPNTGFELSSLGENYDPCEDFFRYTAQGWIDNNPIPGSESRWGRFGILAKENEKKVRAILDGFVESGEALTAGSDEQLVGDLYISGMDSLRIEELKFAPLAPMMKRIENVKDLEGWVKAASSLQMHGVSMPFGVYVGADDRDASMNALRMYQSGLGLPDRSYYIETDSVSISIREAYVNHIQKMFEMYGMESIEAGNTAQRIFDFEEMLALEQSSRVDLRDPIAQYNKMSLDTLKALAPQVPFDAYFAGKGIDNPNTIIVSSVDYFAWMGEHFSEWNVDVLKAYSQWQVIKSYASALHHDAVAENFAFYGVVLQGTPEMKPRWRRVQSSMGGLKEQIGHLFADRHFSPEQKVQVEQMVEDLRSAFRVRIQQLEWMSPETKEKALEKLEAFTYKIGYPDKWSDWSNLSIDSERYVENLMNLSAYITADQLSKIGEPVDKDEWYMGAHWANAYYNPNGNEVVFPAGILQFPFFDPNADDAINYGAIGGVIGHEFTHGFDDSGAKYDKDGNLNNWWTSEDSVKFAALTDKVVKQYNSYEALPGEFVNGELTLGENIADLGGLTLAYHAYLIHRGDKSVDPIGGFTDEQRVFLGWAQVWQSHSTEEGIRFRLKNDPHSPAPFRVNGPTSNIPEFWEAFGCGEESEMHLSEEEHSLIW